MSKQGVGGKCGDAIYYNNHFAAVIDGATPKSSLLWENEPSDVFIANFLKRAFADLPREISMQDAFQFISISFAEHCKGINRELSTMRQDERPQASVVIYSDYHKEIWSLGDCRYLVNGKEHRDVKDIDILLSRLRAFVHEVNEVSAESGATIPWPKGERVAIQPFLEQQPWLANKRADFGYGVLNGSPEALNFVEVTPVESPGTIVLATDGYPRLFPTLEQTEAFLRECLDKDPGCYHELCGTKGIVGDNVSYDDRAYLSLRC